MALAAYARYGRRLAPGWDHVYVFATAGALFLSVLIATAQSFLHVRFLRSLAPTQHSPAYVAIKVALLLGFVAAAVVVARRLGRGPSAGVRNATDPPGRIRATPGRRLR